MKLLFIYGGVCLLLSSCCTGVENQRHSVPVTYSLQNAEIALGNSFDIEVFVPDINRTVDGILTNISAVDFTFGILLFEYVDEENLRYTDFPNAINDFKIEALRVQSGPINRPEQVANGRRWALRIRPKTTGTFVLLVNGRGGPDMNVRTCSPSHDLAVRNDQFPIQENFPNINENASGFPFGQQRAGLLLFSVN